jgi:hypothetical protein
MQTPPRFRHRGGFYQYDQYDCTVACAPSVRRNAQSAAQIPLSPRTFQLIPGGDDGKQHVRHFSWREMQRVPATFCHDISFFISLSRKIIKRRQPPLTSV